VVEDSQINAEVIVNLLKAKGINSEVAANGEEAVKMYKEKAPYYYNAILMDIMMPVKDGFEATKEIRESKAADADSIPIVALTADTFAATEEKCLKAGMNGHLPKPIDTNALYTILSKEIERTDHQQI
ncbi:MAG: response regulator, partial [Catenibacterium mitsuokai]